MSRKVTIAGAGLAGALLAIFLRRRGLEVVLYERRPDPRGGPVEAGRSINMALSHRGIKALRKVGLAEQVLARALPMRGRRIHRADGTRAFQPYGTEPHQVIHSIGRAELNLLLVEAAERAGVEVRFGRRLVEVDLGEGDGDEPARLRFVDPSGATAEEVSAEAVIGADGAFSAVRGRLARLDRFDYQQSYLAHGYKELLIPALEGGGHALEPDGLHIWPRADFMLIGLPNPDGSFTGTLFMAHEGRQASFAALREPHDVESFFARELADVVPLVPGLGRTFLANPTGSLVTVRCWPWHAGPVGLFGDAAHAVVPFYGQGMNACFEDCLVLDGVLDELPGPEVSWQRAFSLFQERRKADTDALAELAIGNYHEMRQKTASLWFLAEKRLEAWLHRRLGARFVPLYTMVTFSRMPYADVVRRDRAQRRVLALGLAFIVALVVALGAWLAS